MNYSKAFSFVFDDKDWLSKILIAGLIALIPVIGQIYLIGWNIEIIRRYKAGRTDLLPATHFSAFLTLGLKFVVVGLIYSLPIIILSVILNLFTGIASSSDSGTIEFIFGSISCFGGLLSLVINFLIALVGIYGMIKIAETDQIKACLDVSDIFNCIRANLSNFIIVALLIIVAELIQSAGLVICIGILFTVPYGNAISAYLVGQLWDNMKPYDKTARPIRGAVQNTTEDIIEAPFTKVDDIEKNAADEAPAEKDEDVVEEPAQTRNQDPIDIPEPVDEAPAPAEEPEAPAAEEPAAWNQTPIDIPEPADDPQTPAEEPAENKSEDDDLPSFE